MPALFSKVINHIGWKWQMLRKVYWPQWWYARWLPAQVQSGPFQGMLYGRSATGSVILPKLLGTYEIELHPFLLAIKPEQYEQFIDIGAGEGYYAAGLCYRFPKAQMLAFESTPIGQRRIRALASKNGLAERIKIYGKCGLPQLRQALTEAKRVLLIVDVEGYESELLNPIEVPGLKQVDFIVEMHPERVENIETLLSQRFAASHKLQIIPQLEIRPIPIEVKLPTYLAQRSDFLVNEFRGPQSWMIGIARSKDQS